MSDGPWDTCHACGGVIDPQRHHQCGPFDWALHQGAILADIREILQELKKSNDGTTDFDQRS
jgi:hypothetical protein